MLIFLPKYWLQIGYNFFAVRLSVSENYTQTTQIRQKFASFLPVFRNIWTAPMP